MSNLLGTARLLGLAALMAGAAVAARAAEVSGTVMSGDTPIPYPTVTLYEAGSADGAAAASLGQVQAGEDGSFSIHYTAPAASDAVLYLVADNAFTSSAGRSPGAVRLATVLGTAPVTNQVVINERSTVATAVAMAQFIDGTTIAGPSPGMQNAALTLRNIVDVESGEVASLLGTPPNGLLTSTMKTFNTMANMLAACIESSKANACNKLFKAAKPPGGSLPGDTLTAAINIAHYPWQHVNQLFKLAKQAPVYEPYLDAAPDAWTIALIYVGNGHELNGAGYVTFDAEGNAWVANNYVYSKDVSPEAVVCGGEEVIKLTPDGKDAPNAPFEGGGVYGAGFGATIAKNGNAWIGNFSFQGRNCTKDIPANSVSEFKPDGTPRSPANTGWTYGDINGPQGMAADNNGNVWIANCGSDSVTLIPDGVAQNAKSFSDVGVKGPFGLAVDAKGNAWVAGNISNNVVAVQPDGTPLPGTPFTDKSLSYPFGIAVDSLGNVWVANNATIPICARGNVVQTIIDALNERGHKHGRPSVVAFGPDGKTLKGSPYRGGGIDMPWGIAVDGGDHVWVANFNGQRVSELCGARTETCPAGFKTGQGISPNEGYGSDALVRVTSVTIDGSGNVWLANNWKQIPIQSNPGGYGVVVFVGLATPVQMPLLGPPEKP